MERPRVTGHLQVPMDDGRLALMQAGDGLAGVAEDVEDLGLTEAHVQPLVHLLHHLARCGRGGRRRRRSRRQEGRTGNNRSLSICIWLIAF